LTPSAIPTLTPTPAPTPTPTPTPPSIASLRGLPVGTSVTVDGVVVAEPPRLGTPALIAIDDTTGGIFVRLPDGVGAPRRGSHLVVAGRLAAPYGQLEVRPPVGGVVPAPGLGPTVTALAIRATDLGEATEGRLGSMTGTIDGTPSKTSAGGLAGWLVDDAGDRARILVAAGSGIGTPDLQPGHRYRLTGVVGQRASRTGALDGYRLWLRDRADVVHLAAPSPSASPTPSTSPIGPPAVVSIARALALHGRTVSVIGVVTIQSTLLDATGRRIVIQDGTAAIEVRTPTGVTAPSPGRRIRIVGEVGRAYDAPRIQATELVDLGTGSMPQPRQLGGPPTVAVEWRLVRVSGTVVDVHKLGDRWRAEIEVGKVRVPIQGLTGSRIAPTALVEGRRATVVGIARRPYPGTADRRFSVVPRSRADIALAAAASGAGPASTAGTAPDPRDGAPGDHPAASPAPTVELGSLADHPGERVRVGGLVAELATDGFTLDDGTATARIVLTGDAAAYQELIDPGDALEATGRVELDGVDGPRLVVDSAADLVRVGDLGASGSTASVDPGVTGSGTASAAPEPGPTTRVADVGGALPDPTVLGAGWLGLVIGLSVVVGLVRRRRMRRALAARVAARLAQMAGPRGSS